MCSSILCCVVVWLVANKQYHSMVLRATRIFLEQRNAIEYVNSFDAIIKLAHQIVVKKAAAAAAASASASAAGGAGEDASATALLAGPAADLIATTISLFKRASSEGAPTVVSTTSAAGRRATKQQHQRAQSALSAVGVVMQHSILPVRSLHNAIGALRQVVRTSPMFPKT
jgi:hypothetical protein